MPKSANSIDCQCGGHYVKKNRSKHMETNKHQTYIQNLKFIEWNDMDFGTARSSYCGICGKKEPGYFKNGELQGDIICHNCDLIWLYDEATDRYGRRHTDEQYNQPCSNGCGTILTENINIFCLSKEGEEDEQWCSECFHDCGMEAREEGWKFDEEGEQLLDEMEAEEKIEYLCRHCEDTTTDPDECDNCGYSPELGNCPDKECEMCYGDEDK